MARACCWRELHSVLGQPHRITHLPQGTCSSNKPEPGQTLGQGHTSIDREDRHIQQTPADSHVCWEGRGARPGEGRGALIPGSWATEMGAVGSGLSVQCSLWGPDGCPAGQKRQYYYES